MSALGKQIALISCPETPDEIREHFDAYIDAVANLRHESFIPYMESKLLPVVLQRMENANLRGKAPTGWLKNLRLSIEQIEIVGARDEEKETELAWIQPLITERDFVEVLAEALLMNLAELLMERFERLVDAGDDMDEELDDKTFDKWMGELRYYLLPYIYVFYELAKTGVVVGLAFDAATDNDGKELDIEGNGVTDGLPAIWVYSPLERLYYVYDVVIEMMH